jgi:hypothetical protein
MDLDKDWYWKSRVLDCRVRPETGNPSGDDLRERLAELTGVPLVEILAQMKAEKQLAEKKAKGIVVDYEKEKKFKEVLKRTHIAGAAQLALTNMRAEEFADTTSKSKKNINKAFCVKPKSPSKRVLMDALRETGKNVTMPDTEDAKAAAIKLEKKLAKARLARKEQMDEAAKGELEKNEKLLEGLNNTQGLSATCLPAYAGDLFGSGGDYFKGTLYLSRMEGSLFKIKWSDPVLHEELALLDDMMASTQLSIDGDSDGADDFLDIPSNDIALETDTAAKLYCAVALCNWSRNPSNAQRLASEGAVKAIIRLLTEDNKDIIKFAVAAFRFMSEHAILATALVDDGAIRSITEFKATDDFSLSNVTIALINLTRVNGKESRVVDDGILTGLMNVMKESPELASACCRGIYNLTCVDQPYQVT